MGGALASAPKNPSYLGGMMGSLGGFGDPEQSGPPKSIKRQDLGSVVGRRGAGISQITGGDQAMHSMHHYGKNAASAAAGGDTGLSGLIGGRR